jgi:hypothetical protein
MEKFDEVDGLQAPDLTEAEIRGYVGRCPEENRPLFEAWLRGERDLAGDLLVTG